MYVGDTADGSGLHYLLFEVVESVVDLHLAREVSELHVTIAEDGWVTIRDDGPGFSIAIPPREEASELELFFTTLRVRPNPANPKRVRGFGFGLISALSTRTEVETTRSGTRWAIAFERGVVSSPLRRAGGTTVEGTLIRFRPDPQIFKSVAFDAEHVREHLQHAAWLNPLLRVFFQERRLTGRGGLRGWAAQLAGEEPELLFSTEQTLDDIHVEVALAWRGTGEPVVHSFVNMRSSSNHGTHVQGMYSAFDNVDDRGCLERGLIAIIHVSLDNARWRDATRAELTSPEAGVAVSRVLREHLVGTQRFRDVIERRLTGR
jgi:DNA gyrase subunit B